MKFKKHHIVLAALVAALSAAVFINWQLNDRTDTPVVKKSKELGAATYVSSNISSDDEVLADTNNKNLSAEQIEYFAASRSDRRDAFDEAVGLATEVLKLTETSQEAKEEAVEQLSSLENSLLSQQRIETVLKAKGFSDCVCCLSETSCVVIIPANEMNESSPLIIRDCVVENTGLPFENISIVEV